MEQDEEQTEPGETEEETEPFRKRSSTMVHLVSMIKYFIKLFLLLFSDGSQRISSTRIERWSACARPCLQYSCENKTALQL